MPRGYSLRVGPAGSTRSSSGTLLIEAALIGPGLVGWCSRFSRAKARACCCKSSMPRRKSASEQRLHSGASSRAASRASMRSRIPNGTPFGSRRECCQPIGPKACEGKMTNRGAGVSGHANSHNRRDRVHQVFQRFDRHGAICWNFFGCCVQFWTSILEFNWDEKGCWVCFWFCPSAPLSKKHDKPPKRSAAALVGRPRLNCVVALVGVWRSGVDAEFSKCGFFLA